MQKSSFKLGDRVKWVCSPRKQTPFEATGKIVELRKMVFAGSIKKMGARMEITLGSRYQRVMKKRWAIVGVDKLARE